MVGVRAIVERGDFSKIPACIQPASFHEVLAGIEAQRGQAVFSSQRLKLAHESGRESTAASRWNDE